MRFGLFVPQGWRHDLVGIDPAEQWTAMLGVARLAEDLQFESVWVYDHFHTVPVPSEEATHEAWTLMAAFGAATSRVRLGQMCTCMGYRNPMYLAKVAATVDVISGGRTEMGIGAGWYEHEWNAYGYGFPTRRRPHRDARRGRRDHATGVGEGRRDVRRRALPGRRRHLPADAAAGRRHPAVDRRRRREEDPADRGAARRVHELRGASRGLPAQVAGARRPLQGSRPRLRRDRPVGELQRRSSVATRQRSPTGSGSSRSGCGRTSPPRSWRRRCSQYTSGPLVGTPEQILERLRSSRTPA